MKYIKIYPLLLGLGIVSSASASQLTVEVDPFLQPQSGFSFLSSPGLRYSQLDALVQDSENATSHILIQGLTPITTGSDVVISSYEAINLQSGAVQDVGMVYLTLPPGGEAPAGSVSSPIVGVVQRDGAWSNLGVSTPSTTVGDASGPGNYDNAAGTLSFNLTRDAATFTGTANYSVVDQDTIELEAFTLSSGGSNYSFKPSTLVRSGKRFYGTIWSNDTSVGFDSLVFAIQFVNIPDSDLDGIPDIVDPDITVGLAITVGQWTDHGLIGKYYGLTSEWAYSAHLGFFKADQYPLIYQANYGWIYVIDRLFDNIWLYSPDPEFGWLTGTEAGAGMFQSSAKNWEWINLNEPRS